MELGNNIRKIRKQKGLRQEQVAEAMGVSVASVSKWETGQSAPELTMLVELADYFEVSIDFLMGHQIHGKRMDNLLAKMEHLAGCNQFDEAKELAEKLLHSYPNSPAVIRSVANFYYGIFSRTEDKAAMERSIALTKRLLVLEDDPTGARRIELLTRLGNQYAALKEWELSRKYYKDGNVGNMNDRALAMLLANEGRFDEAVTAVSEICVDNIYDLLMCIFQLAYCWENLGQPQKAHAALMCGVSLLDLLDGESVAYLSPLKANYYVELAISAEGRGAYAEADTYAKKAVYTMHNSFNERGYDFCSCGNDRQLVGHIFSSPESVCDYLERIGENRLCSVIKEDWT